MAPVVKLMHGRTVFLVCDVQTRFRTLVHGFEHIVATSSKMLKLAKVLNVPVVITEQNPRALGSTVPELDTASLGTLFLGAHEKTAFSMAIPPVIALLQQRNLISLVLFGLESHICVLQSTLDFIRLGYHVHVVADGISSTHKEEVPIAIAHMRQAGAQITTSETVAFELQGDANKPNFKPFSKIIKEESENTEKALEGLLSQSNKL